MRTASDLLRTPWLTSWSSKILTVLAGRLPACHSLCQPDITYEFNCQFFFIFRSNCETFCNMILFEIPTSTQTSQTVGCLRCKLTFPLNHEVISYWIWPCMSPIRLIQFQLFQACLVALANWDVAVQKKLPSQIRWLRDWNQRSRQMKPHCFDLQLQQTKMWIWNFCETSKPISVNKGLMNKDVPQA